MAKRGDDTFLELPAVTAAAHELKMPLSLIRQLGLRLQAGPVSDSELTKLADRIVLTSERSLRLTTDLTRASRLQAELFDLSPVNPIELCEDVASELEPLFRANSVNLSVRRNRRGMLAVANRDLLKRIIANFSDNALKYAGDNSTVELAASARGQTIRIGVRDYGPAIKKAVWKDLTSSLGSSAQPVWSRPDSSGLGLYLAAEFASHMQGKIGAIRHRDGATFYVDLPASNQLSLL